MIWWGIGAFMLFLLIRHLWRTYNHPATILGRQAANMNWVARGNTAECIRATGLKESDSVEAEVSRAGEIALTPARPFDKAAFLKRVRKLRAGMPMTTATVEAMRQEERFY